MGKKNKLTKLKKKFEEAQEYGLGLQKEGIKIVNYAEQGKEVINFIEETTNV